MKSTKIEPIKETKPDMLHRDVFSKAAGGSKLIKTAFIRLLQGNIGTDIMGRLNAHLMKVIESDELSTPLSRSANWGDIELLRGFEFFPRKALSNYFVVACRVVTDRAIGACTVDLGMINSMYDLKEPNGSHYSFTAAASAIDLDKRTHVTSMCETGLLRMDESAIISLKSTLPAGCRGPILVVLCLRQYKMVSGSAYLMAGNGSGAMAIIEALPGEL